MRPPYATVPSTALAAVAAAIAISLSVFLLPGSSVQPIPLMPAISGAAGRVAADIAPPTHAARKHAVSPRPPVVFRPVFATPAAPAAPVRTVAARHAVVNRPHRVHPARHPHARKPQPRPSAQLQPAEAPAPAPAPTPVARPSAPRGKAKGWVRHHAQTRAAWVSKPSHGNGKALGHSVAHHQKLPPGQAKKALAAAPAAPAAPAPAPAAQAPPNNGHDNGNHNGWGNGNGNQGNGGGGKK